MPVGKNNEKRPEPGEHVILTQVPLGLTDGLRMEDQRAIYAAVGKKALLNSYDDSGRAELEFRDKHGVVHYIYVSPDVIKSAN